MQPNNGRNLYLLSMQQNVSGMAGSLLVQEQEERILQAIKMRSSQYPPATEINVEQLYALKNRFFFVILRYPQSNISFSPRYT